MRKEEQDKLAEKLAELGRHAARQKELTAEAQAAAACIAETYTWVVGKLAAAQVIHESARQAIEEVTAGPPPKP